MFHILFFKQLFIVATDIYGIMAFIWMAIIKLFINLCICLISDL